MLRASHSADCWRRHRRPVCRHRTTTRVVRRSHLRAGSVAIGVLYVGIGLFGLVYRSGDTFMAFFVVLGALLLISGPLAEPRAPATRS
jgi:hypothetical protein